MIDHVLGRPSLRFRKVQVFAAVSFWSLYLYKGDRHGPPILRRLSALLTPRLTTWQTLVVTLIWLYVARNFGKLVGLECPEPLANLYTRSYFRATWVTTALDAGFWSAMRIRNARVRNLVSMICSLYYLVCAEQADEKVRKIRAGLTVDHLRVSWNKPTTPYLALVSRIMRPRLTRYKPRAIRIPRPARSAYREPVMAWLYWDGSLAALRRQDALVLDVPGGGFVAMDPRCHDDKLLAWAGKSGLPVLSLDYRKAPEHPYPYALNECYDVYHSLVATRGRCVGLSGERAPRIIVAGDSAGGNLAAGMVLMVLQSGSTDSRRFQGEAPLPPPEGVVLVYPTLDMNIGNWMTDEQMALMRERRVRKTNEGVLRRKSDDYRKLDPATPMHSDDEDEDAAPAEGGKAASKRTAAKRDSVHLSAAHTVDTTTTAAATSTAVTPAPPPQAHKTRIATSSLLSYFSDRILTPEMMRAMIILYIGPHHRPDFGADFLLSPLLAPDALLARFPQLFLLTGERDPLVDDTVIFAGRVRQAKRNAAQERRELGLEVRGPRRAGVRRRRRQQERSEARSERRGGKKREADADDREDDDGDPDWVQVLLIPGISHGFLQFSSVFPDGWRYIFRCARWMRDVIADAEAEEQEIAAARTKRTQNVIGTDAGAQGIISSAIANGTPKPGMTHDTAEGTDFAVEDPDDTNFDSDRTPQATTIDLPATLHHHRSSTASSTDEDAERPLEMSRVRRGGSPTTVPSSSSPPTSSTAATSNGVAPPTTTMTNGGSSRPSANGTSNAASGRGNIAARRRSRGGSLGKVGKGVRSRRESLRALASEEDLLSRRMSGLTGGLLGREDGVPPTP